MIDYLVNRVAIRSRLSRLPPVHAYRSRASATVQRAFQPSATLADEARSVAAGVRENGVHVVPDPASLGISAPVLGNLIAAGFTVWAWDEDRTLLESDAILSQNAGVYALGLEPALLDLVESYLGQPCYYMGCSLKRERVSASTAGTRQWHYDIEDDRMLRLIFYLNPVEEGGGPFQYIAADRSAAARTAMGYRSGYVSDGTMRSVVPESEWNSVLGPAGSMIAFDGTRVFHRVARPMAAERFSLSITFSSRHPLQIFRQVRLRTASRRRLMATLSERQRACIPGARWS